MMEITNSQKYFIFIWATHLPTGINMVSRKETRVQNQIIDIKVHN